VDLGLRPHPALARCVAVMLAARLVCSLLGAHHHLHISHTTIPSANNRRLTPPIRATCMPHHTWACLPLRRFRVQRVYKGGLVVALWDWAVALVYQATVAVWARPVCGPWDWAHSNTAWLPAAAAAAPGAVVVVVGGVCS
jgi:hypothetical protein